MIKDIFTRGEFSGYRKQSLREAYESVQIRDSAYYSSNKISVFLSHKHDELEDVRDVIGFLESRFNVKCYIDSEDQTLPIYTSSETAAKIKDRIKQCDKFILLATNGAIESKWCNWELGYGDAFKFSKNIAIFPFKGKFEDFSGKEYLKLYPSVINVGDGETYTNGRPIPPGYYIEYPNKDGSSNIQELSEWLRA